jgi:hypothetical protein
MDSKGFSFWGDTSAMLASKEETSGYEALYSKRSCTLVTWVI